MSNGFMGYPLLSWRPVYLDIVNSNLVYQPIATAEELDSRGQRLWRTIYRVYLKHNPEIGFILVIRDWYGDTSPPRRNEPVIAQVYVKGIVKDGRRKGRVTMQVMRNIPGGIYDVNSYLRVLIADLTIGRFVVDADKLVYAWIDDSNNLEVILAFRRSKPPTLTYL